MSIGNVNISATFTKDTREYNGLTLIHDQLVTEGLTRHVVTGVIETKFVKRDVAGGGIETPTVRFVALEVIQDENDAETVRDAMDRQYRKRTGRQGSAVEDDLLSSPELTEDPPSDRDPTAGPWPGDADYQDGESR